MLSYTTEGESIKIVSFNQKEMEYKTYFSLKFKKDTIFKIDCFKNKNNKNQIFSFFVTNNKSYIFLKKVNYCVAFTNRDFAFHIFNSIIDAQSPTISVIAPLFFINVKKFKRQIRNSKLLAEEKINNIDCYIIDLNYLEDLKIWIAKNDYTIQKIRMATVTSLAENKHVQNSRLKYMKVNKICNEYYYKSVVNPYINKSDLIINIPSSVEIENYNIRKFVEMSTK